ncbi:MAG: quinolinate synthase NadA [Crenarchaeota archaeon]|nr:quinolinate synthase NadA [Thermoproteota archaeon]
MRISGIIRKIEELKKTRRAVVLAHNYQIPEVQDVADHVGDSLELAIKAMECEADIIVFAGVSFMAEMAAVLNPDKIVLHPEPDARCPLADFLPPSIVREYRSKYPRAPIVLYVNSLLESKVYADYVVTSAAACRLISKLEDEIVIFGPDKNLANYVEETTGKEIITMPPYGHCPVHEYALSIYYVNKALELYENERPVLIVHPEVPRDVRRIANNVGSTSQMLKMIEKIDKDSTVLIGTEEGLTYRARRLYPNRKIVPVNPQAVCIDMKKINLLSVLRSLERLKYRVQIDPDKIRRAREIIEISIELMRK